MLNLRLHELDRSSTGFPQQLDKLLQDEQWVESVGFIPGDEISKLIDCLDSVRSVLTPTGYRLLPVYP